MTASALVAMLGCAAACREAPVVRAGPPQQRVVARTYAAPMEALRDRILDRFRHARPALPEPFRELTANELRPPYFRSDWADTLVDPGGYLGEYRHIDPAARVNDLLLEDPSGDLYWPSEYQDARGAVRFSCGLILHFAAAGPLATDIQVFERVPTVWVGERWTFAMHGIGFGRYHDIRFVEPTMKERLDVLDLIDRILKEPR